MPRKNQILDLVAQNKMVPGDANLASKDLVPNLAEKEALVPLLKYKDLPDNKRIKRQ